MHNLYAQKYTNIYIYVHVYAYINIYKIAYLRFHHANWRIHAAYNVALVACGTLIAKISPRCARAELFAAARECVCVWMSVYVGGWAHYQSTHIHIYEFCDCGTLSRLHHRLSLQVKVHSRWPKLIFALHSSLFAYILSGIVAFLPRIEIMKRRLKRKCVIYLRLVINGCASCIWNSWKITPKYKKKYLWGNFWQTKTTNKETMIFETNTNNKQEKTLTSVGS